MSFCNKCGAQLPEGVKFCVSCGQPVEQPTQSQSVNRPISQPSQQSSYPQPTQGGYQQPQQPGYQQPTQGGYQQYGYPQSNVGSNRTPNRTNPIVYAPEFVMSIEQLDDYDRMFNEYYIQGIEKWLGQKNIEKSGQSRNKLVVKGTANKDISYLTLSSFLRQQLPYYYVHLSHESQSSWDRFMKNRMSRMIYKNFQPIYYISIRRTPGDNNCCGVLLRKERDFIQITLVPMVSYGNIPLMSVNGLFGLHSLKDFYYRYVSNPDEELMREVATVCERYLNL